MNTLDAYIRLCMRVTTIKGKDGRDYTYQDIAKSLGKKSDSATLTYREFCRWVESRADKAQQLILFDADGLFELG